MQQNMNMPMGAENMGRATDNTIAHVTIGEVVLPLPMLSDPEIGAVIRQAFEAAGIDINEFTVGHPSNKINPETGYPEFFKLKRIFRRIAPLAAIALPALAPGLGAALGGSILGAGAAGSATLGNALIGGALSGLSGGNPLLGAAGGAIGANLGSLPTGTVGGGATLPWNQGSGILGAVGNATGISSGSNLGSALSGLTGSSGGGSTFGVNNLASALGGFAQDDALKRQRDMLLNSNQQQQANLERLRNIDVTQEPGYQFAVREGNQALNSTLGAQGNLFSGRALRAASDLNQDLATRFYNDAYQREAQRIGAGNQLIGNAGEIRSNTLGARSNNMSSTIANALGGSRQYSQDDIINMLMSGRL